MKLGTKGVVMSETKRTCGNCAFWCDSDYCPFTMNLYPALFEAGCVNHRTASEFSADYKRMVGEEVMNAEKRLKPCPFCGADEESGVHIETIWDDKEKFRVFCENCGVSTWGFKSIEQAVEAWNRRAE